MRGTRAAGVAPATGDGEQQGDGGGEGDWAQRRNAEQESPGQFLLGACADES